MNILLEGGTRLQRGPKRNAPGLPLISIITATLSVARFLPDTIRSIREQNYPNIEWIIIDGGSTDETPGLLKANEDIIDYWLSEPDGGIYDAWNKGVRLANGDWVAFLGAGDSYLPDAVQSYADFIDKFGQNELPEYISSRVNIVSDGQVVRTIGQPWIWKNFCKYMTVAHAGSFHHRSLFELYGLYDTAYRICGDYELLLRPRKNLRAAFMNKVTVNMILEGESIRNRRVFDETLRAKVSTGGRGELACQLEKVAAIAKWKVRNLLGYWR